MMFDWFDPGLATADYTGMHTTPIDYARARLEPSDAALDAYRSPSGGSYHVTLLRRGMSHTAFTDLPWMTTPSQDKRSRYAEYLDLIRLTALNFFDGTLKRNSGHLSGCDSGNVQVLVQCYEPLQER